MRPLPRLTGLLTALVLVPAGSAAAAEPPQCTGTNFMCVSVPVSPERAVCRSLGLVAYGPVSRIAGQSDSSRLAGTGAGSTTDVDAVVDADGFARGLRTTCESTFTSNNVGYACGTSTVDDVLIFAAGASIYASNLSTTTCSSSTLFGMTSSSSSSIGRLTICTTLAGCREFVGSQPSNTSVAPNANVRIYINENLTSTYPPTALPCVNKHGDALRVVVGTQTFVFGWVSTAICQTHI
jgi:hypothetical protein